MWVWRARGRTTGGGRRHRKHTTRLVTPKGSADIGVRGSPERDILSLGAMDPVEDLLNENPSHVALGNKLLN